MSAKASGTFRWSDHSPAYRPSIGHCSDARFEPTCPDTLPSLPDSVQATPGNVVIIEKIQTLEQDSQQALMMALGPVRSSPSSLALSECFDALTSMTRSIDSSSPKLVMPKVRRDRCRLHRRWEGTGRPRSHRVSASGFSRRR